MLVGLGGVVGDDNDASAGAGAPYLGGGIFVGSSFYGYASFNVSNYGSFIQLGLGFGI